MYRVIYQYQRNTKPTKKMRTKAEIIKDMQSESIKRNSWNAINNESATDGYNPHDDTLDKLGKELDAANLRESPLTLNLAAERAWFNAQGFTGADLQRANQACLARGYSLAELQRAAKKA